MRIGVIGAGRVGSTLARHLDRAGHDVVISNSRGPESLAALVDEIGGALRAGTAEEAAEFGPVVVLSIPYGRYRELPSGRLRDKVVIDTCNYYPERDGHDPSLDDGTTTSSERLRAYTDSHLVKALNILFWETLRDQARPKGHPERLAVPVSCSDQEAKAVVSGLVRDIGFDPVDAGFLGPGGRKHQPGTRAYTAELSAPELSALLRS